MRSFQSFVKHALVAASILGVFTGSSAAEYPDRAIKLVVGFPAGQSSDANARRIANGMAIILKQSVVVDNKQEPALRPYQGLRAGDIDFRIATRDVRSCQFATQ